MGFPGVLRLAAFALFVQFGELTVQNVGGLSAGEGFPPGNAEALEPVPLFAEWVNGKTSPACLAIYQDHLLLAGRKPPRLPLGIFLRPA